MRKIDILNKDYEKIGLDTIVYTNKTIDEVCYVDSDGKQFTYRDIFETGNLVVDGYDFATSWNLSNANGSVVDGIYQFIAIAQYGNLQQTIDLVSGIDCYIAGKIKSDSNLVRLYFNSESTVFGHSGSGEYEILSGISAITTSTKVVIADGRASGWTQVDVDYVMAINTGIFTSIPSQSKLNEWRDVYLARRNITKETYTLREFMALNEDITTMNQMTLVNGVWEQSMTAGVMSDNYSDQLLKDYEKYFIKLEINYDDRTLITYFRWYDGIEWKEYLFAPPKDLSYIKSDLGYLRIAFGSTSSIVQKQYITEIFVINLKNFDEYMTKEVMDYIVAQYKQVKYEIEDPDKVYGVNGKSKTSIAYINKTIDEVVYEGKTLRDIFEHGNEIKNPYFDNIDLSDYNQSNAVANVVNGIAEILASALNGTITQLYGVRTIGDYYYQSAKLKADSNLVSLNTNGSEGLINHSGSGLYEDLSDIYEVTSATNGYLRIAMDSRSSGWTTNYADDIFVINLNDIFIIKPSKAQMDIWRDMFIARKDLEKIELTYSDIFENQDILYEGEIKQNVNTSPAYFGLTNQNIWSNDFIVVNKEYYLKTILNVSSGGATLTEIVFADAFEYFEYIKNDNEAIESYYESSAIKTFNDYLRFRINDPENIRGDMYFIGIALEIFDERITQAQLDLLFAEFQLIRNVIIVPEVFVITEPIGLGKRYKMLKVGDYIYGHELDFERIGFKMQFGINYSAYDGYNLMMIFLKNSEAIIEYDWGKGSRFADVKLLHAPKTEKDTFSLIVSKFAFELLNPFYELIVTDDSAILINTHTQDLDLKLEMQVDNIAVLLEMDCEGTENDLDIEFDFTGVSVPFNLIIDAEKKTITKDDGTNMYGYLNFSGDSFFVIPGGVSVNEFVVNGVSDVKITYKQWVVD